MVCAMQDAPCRLFAEVGATHAALPATPVRTYKGKTMLPVLLHSAAQSSARALRLHREGLVTGLASSCYCLTSLVHKHRFSACVSSPSHNRSAQSFASCGVLPSARTRPLLAPPGWNTGGHALKLTIKTRSYVRCLACSQSEVPTGIRHS